MLGVSEDADAADIKKAYRKLAMVRKGAQPSLRSAAQGKMCDEYARQIILVHNAAFPPAIPRFNTMVAHRASASVPACRPVLLPGVELRANM